ncbi:MAG: DUF438 domain-containing protein [Firmicutes bacterium]|nr:DUF438 domain-containing protein [Bacillota bacterium]
MTELINNRAYRQEQLKQIIRDLHSGKTVDEVKDRFAALLKDVGATEIAQLEQALIDEGLPETEVKRLCDVHVQVFQDSLDLEPPPESVPGHPVHTMRLENEALGKVIAQVKGVLDQLAAAGDEERSRLIEEWKNLHQKLCEVEKHYSRKENLLFPILERNGISGPPSVMWSLHDDIRAGLKEISSLLDEAGSMSAEELKSQIDSKVRPVLEEMDGMIYKEEKILLPMCLETLSEDEWLAVAQESDDIGYALVKPAGKWQPARSSKLEAAPKQAPEGYLEFPTGFLTLREIELIFNHLPVDITFVDKDNVVRYFSAGPERFFTRTKAVIGRKVERCHPPESVHVVTQIVEDFKSGKRDVAEFWIRMKGQLLYIRYFPVRDDAGEYIGVLEVTQNVTRIQELKGEKRLLDPEETEG